MKDLGLEEVGSSIAELFDRSKRDPDLFIVSYFSFNVS